MRSHGKIDRMPALLAAFFLSAALAAGCGAATEAVNKEDTEAVSTESAVTEATEASSAETGKTREDDIIILYTNDIHTEIHGELSFASLADYRNTMLEQTPYVTLVDNGDAVQGNYICAISKGTAIMQAMNEVGYDLCILGNHEFDYKLDGLKEMMETADAPYLNCNITYSGEEGDPFGDMQPYAILEYGDTRVGFVGVTTPDTVESTSPLIYVEEGETVVDFCRSEDGQALYDAVQTAVDAAREEGADYVILMAHLGIAEPNGVYRSTEVIAHTDGIDAVLDGHSHSVIEGEYVENKDGQQVLLSSTGTRMQSFGQLTIGADGGISSELIYEWDGKDEEVEAWLTNLEDVYEGYLGEPLFTLDQELSIYNEDGLRLVRAQETGIGNFVADAYREVLNADIGMCNGGGVRDSLPAGEVSELNLINVNPFGNMMCTIEVTGAEILDILEYSYQYATPDFIQDGVVVAESGSFMQISGLTCVVDSSVPSSVEVDADDNLISVGESRRVQDVKVLQDGAYVPIDPEATYTIATNDYIAKNGGCGMALYLADHVLPIDSAFADYEALLTYATEYLDGDLSRYYQTEDRITIK